MMLKDFKVYVSICFIRGKAKSLVLVSCLSLRKHELEDWLLSNIIREEQSELFSRI